MKALVVPTSDDKTLSALTWIDRPQPTPGAEEVLVKVHAVGLNPVDVKLVAGGNSEWVYPHTLGLDVAGVVTAVGAEVTRFKVGQRVCVHGNLAKNGAFAEFVVELELALAEIPDALSFETAAASLCAGLTAYQAVYRKLNLNNVDTVLVHAGAGGVGSMAIQLLHQAHKRVFTTVSKRKQASVLPLAQEAIIDYRNEDVDARINELTGSLGVDVVINTIGHPEADLPRLAYNGQLVCVLDTPKTAPVAKALTISNLDLGGAHRSGNQRQVADLGRMTEALLNMVDQKLIDPMISQVLPRTKLVAGLQQLAADQVVGKLVVTLFSQPLDQEAFR